MNKRVLLYGGGLDSLAYLLLLKDKIDLCLHIDYGQRASVYERRSVEYFCAKHNIPLHTEENVQIARYNDVQTCSLFTNNPEHSAWVRGRNLSLIMQALEYGKTIYLGLTEIGYTQFSDSNPEFLKECDSMVKRVFGDDTHILAPFAEIHRLQLFEEAYKIDNEFFDKAATCWYPVAKEVEKDRYGFLFELVDCGKCKKCVNKAAQKEEVLKKLGVI